MGFLVSYQRISRFYFNEVDYQGLKQAEGFIRLSVLYN